MITDKELDQLEAVCKAATPGPWRFRRLGAVKMDGQIDGAAVESCCQPPRPEGRSFRRRILMMGIYYDRGQNIHAI